MVGGKYADIWGNEVRCGYAGGVLAVSGKELLTRPEVGVLATTASSGRGKGLVYERTATAGSGARAVQRRQVWVDTGACRDV